MSDPFDPNRVDALDFLQLRYKLAWPLNIVVDDECVQMYNQVGREREKREKRKKEEREREFSRYLT
jgi:hypothetical protein